MCMHFDIAPLGRFALDVLIALDVESVYFIIFYNIWVYIQIFIKAINILWTINVFAPLGLECKFLMESINVTNWHIYVMMSIY